MNSARGIAALVVLGAALTLVDCDNNVEIVDCFSCKCNPRFCAPTFQDLSQKWHVLNNFELAHNKKDMSHYDQLIDDNYTFSFDTVNNGNVVTIQWGRPDEITTTAGLMSAADVLHVDLTDIDKATWTSMTASDNSGETWYTTTVYYNFTIKIGPTTYTPVANAQMSFTVRNAGTTAKPAWRLVELRDDAHIIAPPPAVASALHTEQSTYGKVKSGL